MSLSLGTFLAGVGKTVLGKVVSSSPNLRRLSGIANSVSTIKSSFNSKK